MRKNLGALSLAGVFVLAACDQVAGNDGGTNNPDAGPAEELCPGPLPTAAITCTAAECSATTGTKNFGEATLAATAGKSWVIPVWAVSEVAGVNDTATIDYTMMMEGGLAPLRSYTTNAQAARDRAIARTRAFLGEEGFAQLYGTAAIERVRAEAAIRAMQYQGEYSFAGVSGTAVRGLTDELLPDGVHRQGTACSASTPACGETALCVIPEGTTSGTCESALMIKFRTGNTTFDTVTATVKKVGTFGAIVVDDADAASVTAANIDEILERFDTHIAPLDHQFFGEAKNAQGQDRDGNGVTMFFLTNRVSAAGASVVGYFQSDDLIDSATEMTSNAADILYLRPPSGSISLDAISGTIGHEYQHLINYYQKKILRQSGPEDQWLDEGLAGFAEDMLGYGGDAFKNIAAYLGMIDQTSLTGAGLIGTEDSNQRRGMAHLLVRYVFEQAGGATFASPGSATDKGGIAAVKKLVQSADTGTLLFTTAATGRSFGEWVGDVITTAAIDGAGYDGVSCNPKYSLRTPETDAYTGNQRGIDLRSSFKDADGQTVQLNGPLTATLGNDTGIAIPANGGEVRTVDVATGTVKMSVSGSVDYEVGFRPLPTSK